MASLNKVFLIGNVGQDPKITTFRDGKIANFTLATTERGFTTKDGRKIDDRTEWHNIVARNSSADFAERFIKKGTALFVEGKIATRTYQENSGQTRYVTEIIVVNLQLLGSKPNPNGGVYRPMNDYPEN